MLVCKENILVFFI